MIVVFVGEGRGGYDMISKFHYEDVRLDCLEFFSTFTEFEMRGIWNGPDKALTEKHGKHSDFHFDSLLSILPHQEITILSMKSQMQET